LNCATTKNLIYPSLNEKKQKQKQNKTKQNKTKQNKKTKLFGDNGIIIGEYSNAIKEF